LASYEADIMRTMLLVALLLSACSGVQVKQRPDGTYAVECSNRKACLDRAERICEREGYTVVGGKNEKKLYGVPGNEKLIGKEELYIRCAKDRPIDTPDEKAGSWKLKHEDKQSGSLPSASAGSVPASPPATEPPPSAAGKGLVCRPGETQRCVGPAACEGGQACQADGRGFGPCDCGKPSDSSTSSTKLP
jgi:hypothetical protein